MFVHPYIDFQSPAVDASRGAIRLAAQLHLGQRLEPRNGEISPMFPSNTCFYMETYSFNRSKITSLKYIHFRWKQLIYFTDTWTIFLDENCSLLHHQRPNGTQIPSRLAKSPEASKQVDVGLSSALAIESMFVNVCFWQSLDFAKVEKLLVVSSGNILFNSDSRNSPLLVDFLYLVGALEHF